MTFSTLRHVEERFKEISQALYSDVTGLESKHLMLMLQKLMKATTEVAMTSGKWPPQQIHLSGVLVGSHNPSYLSFGLFIVNMLEGES